MGFLSCVRKVMTEGRGVELRPYAVWVCVLLGMSEYIISGILLTLLSRASYNTVRAYILSVGERVNPFPLTGLMPCSMSRAKQGHMLVLCVCEFSSLSEYMCAYVGAMYSV